ncbi:AAA family ATPase, partial [Nocardia cyriacigeorgica]|uniref:AAA family ATPase n=1 Tax=Nocardia cyriacigeorgica TaxID=135487 RepID=UPI002454813C
MAGSHDLDSHHRVRPAGPTEIPALPFTPIPRPLLLDELNQFAVAANGRVLLVCSPVGSGKTVLLSDWAERMGPRLPGRPRIGWLTIAEQSYTARGMWAELRARLGLPVPASAALRTPVAEAAELVADIGHRGRPTVVVLDDAHQLTDPMALAGREHLLRNA